MSESPNPVSASERAPASAAPSVTRKPFERPAVQELGQLTLLTLVSGGGSI